MGVAHTQKHCYNACQECNKKTGTQIAIPCECLLDGRAVICTICAQSVREIAPFGAVKFALCANEISALPQLRKI